jgi:hypothetical protein
MPSKKTPQKDPLKAPLTVKATAVTTFFGLLLVGLLSVFVGPISRWIPTHHLGSLPVGMVWFAATGGSLASLTGIIRHDGTDWDASWNLWHMMRPATGAVMGVLGAFFLLVSTQLATGATGKAVPVNPDIYYAAAFMAGFAEEPFRDLIKRLTDALYGTRRCCDTSPCDACKDRARDLARRQSDSNLVDA